VTARTAGASSGPVRVSGSGGAKFFGFVASGGRELGSITVSSDDTLLGNPRHPRQYGGFAVSEFAIHGA
jgi:hypothetical protein